MLAVTDHISLTFPLPIVKLPDFYRFSRWAITMPTMLLRWCHQNRRPSYITICHISTSLRCRDNVPSKGYSATQVPIGCIGAASVTSSSKSSKLSCCSLLVCSDAGDVDDVAAAAAAATGVVLMLPALRELWRETPAGMLIRSAAPLTNTATNKLLTTTLT